MKKIGNLLIAAVVMAVVAFSSCNKIAPKEVDLANMNDSVNYTLGLWQGSEFKNAQFQGDSTGKKMEAFIKALDKAYAGKDNGEMYNLGLQVGKYIKDQSNPGLFGDSTITSNQKLILQGLVNALNEYEDVMTAAQADSIVQTAMMKVQAKQYGQQPMQ